LLQPVGWTPIGYALEQASADFTQPASDDVVNAIVMVTDGLETCDADPAAIASQLRNSDAGISTHVIGFGTTPEEQTILSSIARAGEGQLLGSDNTGQLMSALFEILEELEVVEETGSGEARNSPLGVGRIGEVGDFELSVISVTPNANDIVATENEFNDLPTANNQFFLVTVSATYVGAASGNPSFDLDYLAVGASSSSYATYTNTCGVVPNDLYSVTDQFTGGTTEFNICWQVESADAESLVMYVESFLSFSDPPVWFSLGNPIEETVDPDQPASTPSAGGSTLPTEAPPTPTVVPEQTSGNNNSLEIAQNSTRVDPVPIGQAARVGDFELSVISVTPNANDIVATENEFNDLPTANNQFFLVTVSATCVGAASGNPSFDLDYLAVGASSSSYAMYTNTCGVVPNDLYSVTDQFTGGTTEFNICWQVESADAESLVMYVESFLSFNDPPVWFAIQS
jgi:hypothetical protein